MATATSTATIGGISATVATITITSSSGLGKEEVEKMVREAAAHSDEDKKNREQVEVRNQADSLIHSTDRTLRENKEKLPEAEVTAAEATLAEARKAVEDGGKEVMETAIQNLTKASHHLAELLYQSAAQSAPKDDQTPPPKNGGDDVIDAEVVDKK